MIYISVRELFLTQPRSSGSFWSKQFDLIINVHLPVPLIVFQLLRNIILQINCIKYFFSQ